MIAIICDGPDRCFKTTTLRKLKPKIFDAFHKDIPVYKATSFSEMFISQAKDKKSELFLNRLRHCTLTEIDMQEQIGFDVIYDRHYPSEFVYSQYYGRATDMSILRQVDERFKKLGGKIIFLRRKDYTNWQDDLDTSIDLKKVDQLYESFSAWSCNDVKTIFVDQVTEEQRLQEIMQEISR
jgi:thymidylate kinase